MKSLKLILFLPLLLLLQSTSLGASISSLAVDSGKPVRVLILPNDATPGEQYAAEELQKYVKGMTGADLSSIAENAYSSDRGPYISIGRTEQSRKHVQDKEFQTLGDEGYRIFNKDGNTYFLGGRKRGSLYAVYDYLEQLGVRWYSPVYEVVPKRQDLRLPAKDTEYKPALVYRDQYWNNAPSLEWLARMRINGNNGQTPRIPESMGGCVRTKYGCHSFRELVDAEANFEKQQEWFAIKEDGKARSIGELCLTNPALRDYVTSRVLSDLRNSTEEINNYWVSQNDGGLSGCSCENCTAERVACGGTDRWSANIISFVSHVGSRIKPTYPNVRLKTLAYSYTKDPPVNIKASDNVTVEICGNFREDETTHAQLVKSWFKIAPGISIYTYGGSNYGYWWPYPNLVELGMECPLAVSNGVNAFYVQGTALGKGSGLVDLRAYLTARMAWNPARNVKDEITEFCNGYYGPAAPHIREYIEWYENYVNQNQMVLYESWGDSEAWRHWVTQDAMFRADKLFQRALAAAKENPTYLKHVRAAYLEVLWANVMLNVNLTPEGKPEIKSGADVSLTRSRARLFGEIMKENGYNKIAEHLEYQPDKNIFTLIANQ